MPDEHFTRSPNVEATLFQGETAAECYERRMKWRQEAVKDSWRTIARARAANRGKKFLGVVPVYSSDASESRIEEAIKAINYASWGR